MGDFLHGVVDRVNKKAPMKEKPADIPDYMPLKITIVGEKFSGKKAIASLLKQKYGLAVIDVNEVIDQAVKAVRKTDLQTYLYLINILFRHSLRSKMKETRKKQQLLQLLRRKEKQLMKRNLRILS